MVRELLKQSRLVIVSSVFSFRKRGKYRVGRISVRTFNIGPELAVQRGLFGGNVVYDA